MTLDLPVTEAAKITVPDAQTVTSVTKWTDSLFSFRVTRPASLRFRSGEFVTESATAGRPAASRLRAYSIRLAPAGTTRAGILFHHRPRRAADLQAAAHQAGRPDVTVRNLAVGTESPWTALLPGKRHRGSCARHPEFAPFASLMRDPETYERFEQVIMTAYHARTEWGAGPCAPGWRAACHLGHDAAGRDL